MANAGATQSGDVWTFTNSGTQYEFSELTGQLTVIPEPGILAMTLLGGLGLVASIRRRRD